MLPDDSMREGVSEEGGEGGGVHRHTFAYFNSSWCFLVFWGVGLGMELHVYMSVLFDVCVWERGVGG